MSIELVELTSTVIIELPIATAESVGRVKGGGDITIAEDGTLELEENL